MAAPRTRPPTPLPKQQLFILCCSRLAEPIACANILPYIYFMVQDFGVTDDPNKIGYYVGIIASSFSLAQFFTGLPWGWLSDRIGRRPVILLGLLGTMFGSIMFGLSRSFLWAILARSVCGMLNGNIGVMKSMVGELTDETNQAQAFSFIPFMYGLGCIVGPVLGGFLAKPAEQYPSIFGNCQFLKDYPYFLPNFVAALFCLFSFVTAFFFMEETLESKKTKKSLAAQLLSRNGSKEETKPLLQKPVAEDRLPLRKIFTSSVLLMVAAYVLLCLQAIMFEGLYALWCATSVESGGLGFNANQIGILLSFSGVFTLVVQLLLYPRLQRRFGTAACHSAALTVYIIIYFFQPFANLVARRIQTGELHPYSLWGILLVFLFINRICSVMSFTSTMILVTNVATTKSSLGTVHGLAQMMSSGVRAIGPATAGALFAISLVSPLPFPFDKHMVWTVLTTVAIVTRIEFFYANKRAKQLDEEVPDDIPEVPPDEIILSIEDSDTNNRNLRSRN